MGVNSTVANNLTVGDNCLIGASALIIEDVPDNQRVVGVWKNKKEFRAGSAPSPQLSPEE